MAGTEVTRQDLIDFVVNEARLLDERAYDAWNALFTDDAFYWIPLVPDQADGIHHTSHMYEDKLLRDLRIERLKSPRAFSQQLVLVEVRGVVQAVFLVGYGRHPVEGVVGEERVPGVVRALVEQARLAHDEFAGLRVAAFIHGRLPSRRARDRAR